MGRTTHFTRKKTHFTRKAIHLEAIKKVVQEFTLRKIRDINLSEHKGDQPTVGSAINKDLLP